MSICKISQTLSAGSTNDTASSTSFYKTICYLSYYYLYFAIDNVYIMHIVRFLCVPQCVCLDLSEIRCILVFLFLNEFACCNGPGVVQRKDRQKKEFHDQSDYRQWCMLLMSSTNLSSHTGRHNKQFFSQCSGERQNIFEKLQYHPAPHTPNGNIRPHISSFIHYSFR